MEILGNKLGEQILIYKDEFEDRKDSYEDKVKGINWHLNTYTLYIHVFRFLT